MRWRGVLFDLGDTLIDNHPLQPEMADVQVARAFELWLRRRSMRSADEFTPDERAQLASVDGQRLVAAVRAGMEEARRAYWSAGREAPAGSVFTELQSELAAASGLVASVAELEEVYLKARLARQRALPGAVELLARLRRAGLRCGLVSNCTFAAQLMQDHLRRHDLAALLDVTVYSSEVGWRKPRPEPFLVAAARLAMTPADLVYVGNDPEADLAGGLGAGFSVMWFWGHDVRQEDHAVGKALGAGTWPNMGDDPELAARLAEMVEEREGGPRLLAAAKTLEEVGALLLAGGE